MMFKFNQPEILKEGCIRLTILWHISSHGWGHAARQRELIRVYRKRHPDTRIIVASNVPKWFWKYSQIDEIYRGSPSPVAIETDGDIDTGATREYLTAFIDSYSALLNREIAFQDEIEPDIVITDIDPLPVAAASERSIPATGIGNFTWDWIMAELFPDIREDILRIGEMYNWGTYLRLPMGPDFSPFKQTVEIPLLRSGPDSDPERARSILPEGRICLIAIRELPSTETIKNPDGFLLLSSTPEPVSKDILNITPERLSSMGLTFSDLMAASDVIVSKAGYGIVSQILAFGKPCVLLRRGSFPEEPYLLEPMRGRTATEILNQSDLHLLPGAVMNVLKDPAPFPVDSDGADFIVSGGYLDFPFIF
jgi:L-arabinokinase